MASQTSIIMTNTTATMNENLSIVKLSNKRLYRSDKKGYVLLNGHFLEVKGFGLVRLADGNEINGIKLPFEPVGGLRALKSIVNGGGFTSYNDIEFINN